MQRGTVETADEDMPVEDATEVNDIFLAQVDRCDLANAGI